MNIKKMMDQLVKVSLVSILSIGISISAAEVTETQVMSTLTLEQAFKGAMSREGKVHLLSVQIDAYEEQLKVISDATGTSYYSTQYALNQAVEEQRQLEDVVRYKVTALYQSISLLEKQLELGEQNIELVKKNVLLAEIRAKKGNVSTLELTSAKQTLEKAQVAQTQTKLDLENYKQQFKTLTGCDVDQYEVLEDTFSCEPLVYTGGIESQISRTANYYMKHTETYVAYQNDNVIEVTQSKYGIDVGIPENILKSSKAEIAQTTYSTAEQKKNLIESLRTTATELQKLLESIQIQEEEIISAQTNLTTLQIRYDKGYISEIEVKQQEQTIAQLELAQIQNIYTYNQQKMIFEKPWVRY